MARVKPDSTPDSAANERKSWQQPLIVTGTRRAGVVSEGFNEFARQHAARERCSAHRGQGRAAHHRQDRGGNDGVAEAQRLIWRVVLNAAGG